MIYVKRSDGAYVTFAGMTQEKIVAMLADQGMTCDFLSEEEFGNLAGPLTGTE